MLKCPFCQYANEDGALFCEQCKSDLGVLEAPAPLPSAEESANFIRSMGSSARIPEAQVARPVPVAVPVEPDNSAPVVPLATAVAAALLAPEAGANPSLNVRSDDLPTEAAMIPETTGVGSTISSVETFMAPSHSPVPVTAKSAAPLTKDTDLLSIGGNPRLKVLRGQRINVEYPLYEGDNYIGRADEKPVDIDLEDQEPPDRIWSSRQHALIHSENGVLTVEDLNSSNGTFINRTRLYPGQKRVLNINDIVQIGTVQMKVVN